MQKNVGGQKIQFFAFDITTGAAKTGDAANLTAYVSIDGGSVTVLADTSASELSSSNAPGWYQFDVAQSESNGDALLFSCKSSTSNVSVVGRPTATTPANFATQVINSSGRIDLGTWLGTAPLALSSQQVQAVVPVTQKVDVETIKTQAVTAAAGVTFPASIASPTNITAGTITTVTNLTNAPTAGDLTATMKTSVTTAATAATPTAAAVTGNVGGNVVGSIGSLAAQAKTDVQAADAAALTAYGAATADDVTTAEANIEAAIDLVPAAVLVAADAAPISSNTKKINGVTVTGAGVLGNEWGP